MTEQHHFCTISDRFVVSTRITVELCYEYYGAKQWRITATMTGDVHTFIELYAETIIDPKSVEDMMAHHRTRVADLLGTASSRVRGRL